jgi:hypothetical protein
MIGKKLAWYRGKATPPFIRVVLFVLTLVLDTKVASKLQEVELPLNSVTVYGARPPYHAPVILTLWP